MVEPGRVRRCRCWDVIVAETSLGKSASCFGGRKSFAILRVCISEKEPEDWRMRGRRLRAFDCSLCGPL